MTVKTWLVMHIIAGGSGIVAGFIALYATKGATLHRRAGTVFVFTMLVAMLTGILLSALLGAAPAINVPAGLITVYLVVTALTTVRPPARGSRWISYVSLAIALSVGVICLVFGIEAVASGGERKGMPAFPFFMFSTVGLLGSWLDVRMLRSGGIRGRARLARHLWRMCCALLFASLSFFVGQADEIPEPLRIPPLLAMPLVAVFVTMFYWIWRVRRRALPKVAEAG